MAPWAIELYTSVPTWAVIALCGGLLSCVAYFGKKVIETAQDLAAHKAADEIMFRGICGRLDQLNSGQESIHAENKKQTEKLDTLIGRTESFWKRH